MKVECVFPTPTCSYSHLVLNQPAGTLFLSGLIPTNYLMLRINRVASFVRDLRPGGFLTHVRLLLLFPHTLEYDHILT